MKNQLFRHSPDEKITLQILSLFGINCFEDNHSFTRKNLEDLKTVEKMNELVDSLSMYYIPCKSKKYSLFESSSVDTNLFAMGCRPKSKNANVSFIST